MVFLTGSGKLMAKSDTQALVDSLASPAVFWGDQVARASLTDVLAAQPSEELFQYLESPWALYISATIEVFRKQGSPAVKAVTEHLKAQNEPQKQAICLAVLYEIGSEDNLEVVLPFLDEGKVFCTTVHALRCLAKWGRANNQTIDILKNYLGSDDDSSVLGALHALESILEQDGRVEGIEKLRPALKKLQSHPLKQVSLTTNKILSGY